jgi:signal transduction histidine kinase
MNPKNSKSGISFLRKAHAAGISLLILVTGSISGQTVAYQYPGTVALVSLMNDAAALISQKGEKAFADFMRDGSRWRTGETYTFVVGMNGDVFAHEDTSMIGKNMTDLKDANGKPIIQWFIRKGLGMKQSGWTHYLWPKPGETKPSWKTTYVRLAKSPSGTVYVVGSGRYDMKMEKAFAVEAVNDAVYLIRIEGKSAFPKLRDSASEFVYKDTYIFVLDTNYTLMVNQPYRDLEGQNLYDIRDPAGKYFFREFVEVVKNDDYGWVTYLWPKPGETKPSRKTSFVKKIVLRGETFIVGTGIYLE